MKYENNEIKEDNREKDDVFKKKDENHLYII